MTGKNHIHCPYCNSNNTIKKGRRKRKFKEIQQFQCKSCNKFFSPEHQSSKTYPMKIIANAISSYNLGYNLKEVSTIIESRNKIKLPLSTISSWLSKYKEICTFARLRKQAIKLYKPKNIIFKKPLKHQQVYLFQIHKAKLEILFKEEENKKFMTIKEYLLKIPTENFPHHIFSKELLTERGIESNIDSSTEQRISQLKLETLPAIKLEKQNQANQLAQIALKTANDNKQRHHSIQNFMLINDSTTIATEIPIYLTNDDIEYFKARNFSINLQNYRTPIIGHIDLLQIRNGFINILDYKPNANKTEAVQQLTLYALALASRTKLALKYFKCAWFDENSYYEFFPLHTVYEKQKK